MADNARLFGEVMVQMGLVTEPQVKEALALQEKSGQRVGEAMVTLGYVSRDQLKAALLEAFGLADAPARPRLGEILVAFGKITRGQLDEAMAAQRQDGRRLGEVLVERGHCSYKDIYEALGLQNQHDQAMGAPAPSGPARNAIRVVFVDDSPIACTLFSDGLRGLGFEVHAYEDPYEALEQVARVEPTIVLSDWEMPGLTGEQLCKRLKESPSRNVPVVILTSNEDDTQRLQGLRAGADDYVNKTISMEELAARLETVVRRTSETARVRKLFARYTSDAVVNEAMKSGGSLKGEKREVTVLFADLRGFTALAEGLPPEQVVSILNEVLGRLSDVVLKYGGTVDKFLGDGLIALFGASVARSDDAARAVEAAQAMMVSLEALREDAAAQHKEGKRPSALPPLALGVGVNSGEVVVGNLGSQRRTEYTVIGDAVNVASRLCSIANAGEILVGERTYALTQDQSKFEGLPPVKLKGKARPIALYRVLGT
jgi:adenylate cyclase